MLGSIQPQPLANRPDGTLDLAEVEAAIKPDDPHFARTRLLALENTITGRTIPRSYFDQTLELAKRRNLSAHLDGARLFNAAVKLGIAAKDLCKGFDSVSVCLSKGLGAPAGTVLLGNLTLIAKARRARKRLKDAGYEVDGPHTNMVFVRISPGKVFSLKEKLEKQKILVLPGPRLRLVTHFDVDPAGIERALDAFRSIAKSA